MQQMCVDGRVCVSVCKYVCEVQATYPARCFLDLSEMPSRDMSLLNTTIPISIFTWETETHCCESTTGDQMALYLLLLMFHKVEDNFVKAS